MKNVLKRKLRSRAGESIAESLVSILIVALASILFAGMVTASRNIIDTSNKWMQDYYKAVSIINEKPTDNKGNVKKGSADVYIDGRITKKDVTTYSYTVGGVDIISYVPVEPSPAPAGG